jgi:hypothetical protein
MTGPAEDKQERHEGASEATRHPSGQVTVDDLADTTSPTMAIGEGGAETELLHGAPAEETAETMSELVAAAASKQENELLTAQTLADRAHPGGC